MVLQNMLKKIPQSPFPNSQQVFITLPPSPFAVPTELQSSHPVPSRPPQSVTPSPSSGSPAIASRSNRVREAFKMIAFNFHVFVYWCIYFDRTSFRMWPLTVSCHGWVPNCLLGHSPPDRIHALFFFFFLGLTFTHNSRRAQPVCASPIVNVQLSCCRMRRSSRTLRWWTPPPLPPPFPSPTRHNVWDEPHPIQNCFLILFPAARGKHQPFLFLSFGMD